MNHTNEESVCALVCNDVFRCSRDKTSCHISPSAVRERDSASTRETFACVAAHTHTHTYTHTYTEAHRHTHTATHLPTHAHTLNRQKISSTKLRSSSEIHCSRLKRTKLQGYFPS